MNRFLRIVAALLLATCLASAVLAFTVLRPRSEIVSTAFEEYSVLGIPHRSRRQITRHWRLTPPWEWSFGRYTWGRYSRWCTGGWQYGPFVYEEENVPNCWPVAVEKAARAVAVQKLGVKEPGLEIRRYGGCEDICWNVVASAPSGKRFEMDFDMTFDDHGKLHITRQ
ncbi:MAG: hypothetical protein QM758_05115 [Armatimonas sp.]